MRATKFPPLGDRGHDGAGRDASCWFGASKGYVAQANRKTYLVVQIETRKALDNVEVIAAAPGVDVRFIGPGDLDNKAN